MSRAELIPGDAIAGARKKIDNFLPSRRDGGIVFQKGQETRIALFIDVRALESESKPKGHDLEMAPQAIEIAKNGLGKWRSAALLSFSKQRHGNRCHRPLGDSLTTEVYGVREAAGSDASRGDLAAKFERCQCVQFLPVAIAGRSANEIRRGRRVGVNFGDAFRQMRHQAGKSRRCHGAAPSEAEDLIRRGYASPPEARALNARQCGQGGRG
jgi:hypothetical protein